MARPLVSDELWELIEPLIPKGIPVRSTNKITLNTLCGRRVASDPDSGRAAASSDITQLLPAGGRDPAGAPAAAADRGADRGGSMATAPTTRARVAASCAAATSRRG
jgi:hypothetical protein